MPQFAQVGIAAAMGIMLIGVAAASRSADHPTLVSADSIACRTCHEELLAPRVVHASVREDCSACHRVTILESGTTMALVEAEPALCVMCHDKLSVAVEAGLATPHLPVTESCLICHEPHSGEHDHLLSDPPAEVCGQCHDTGDLGEVHGGQLTTATNCAACHEPHGSANDAMLAGTHLHRPFADGSCDGCHREPFGERMRLRSRNEKLCTACHVELANPGVEGVVVHAALDGERGTAGCLSCHDPHMSRQPKLLVESGPGLCGRCHASIVEQATAETGHDPAGDDCLNCHLPHVSERAALLTEQKDDLCRLCHDVEDSDLVASHLGANLARLDCLGCHTPHGSGHDSLLAENLHPPVEAGCEICHEGAYDELLEDGDSPLCLLCHEEIQQIADEAETPHGALEVARCADCHNPHASPQASLVKAPDGVTSRTAASGRSCCAWREICSVAPVTTRPSYKRRAMPRKSSFSTTSA